MITPALERRPIASRSLLFWKYTAGSLARAGIAPNTISVFGMLAGVLSGVALGATQLSTPGVARLLFAAAAALVLLRLCCNMLDGMVAEAAAKTSKVGELFNEIPDRVSDSATLIGLGYALGGHEELGYAAALLAMFTAYVRAMGKAAGAPQQFCGPMAKPHRMFVVIALSVFCAAAPLAWQPTLQLWEPMGPGGLALLVIAVGSALTALRRLARIALHLRKEQP